MSPGYETDQCKRAHPLLLLLLFPPSFFFLFLLFSLLSLMPLSCAQHSPQLKMCPCEFASMTTTGGCIGAYCAHLCVGNNCGSKSRSGCKHMHRPLSHPLRTYNVSKLLPAADTDFCIQAFYKFAVPISNNTDTRPFPPFWTIGRVMRRCALRLEVHRRRLRQ